MKRKLLFLVASFVLGVTAAMADDTSGVTCTALHIPKIDHATVVVTKADGSVVDSTTFLNVGDKVTLTVTPEDGYCFNSDGSSKAKSTEYTLESSMLKEYEMETVGKYTSEVGEWYVDEDSENNGQANLFVGLGNTDKGEIKRVCYNPGVSGVISFKYFVNNEYWMNLGKVSHYIGTYQVIFSIYEGTSNALRSDSIIYDYFEKVNSYSRQTASNAGTIVAGDNLRWQIKRTGECYEEDKIVNGLDDYPPTDDYKASISWLKITQFAFPTADISALVTHTHYADTTIVNGICKYCHYYEPLTEAGKVDGAYQIKNAGDLYALSDLVNGINTVKNYEKDLAACAKLVNDIDLTNVPSTEYTPISKYDASSDWYNGTFDGDGHTITLNGLPLFDKLGACTIKNLTTAGTVNAKETYLGAVAMYTGADGATISNCHNKANITGEYVVGGIIGNTSNAITIEGCSNDGALEVTGGNLYDLPVACGGIIGEIENGSTTVRKCVNHGTVKGYTKYAKEGEAVGGVVGNMIASDYSKATPSLTACANHGTVTATTGNNKTANKGSLVGYAYNSVAIASCYNSNTENAGLQLVGTIASESSTPTLTLCYDINEGTNTEATVFTAEEQASGALCYKLNGETSTDDVLWCQTLGTDKAPNFSGKIVYYIYETCKATELSYTNNYNPGKQGEHHYINGFCEYCYHHEVSKNSDGVYVIANAGNLVAFAEMVNANLNNTDEQVATYDALVTADIDLNDIPDSVDFKYISPEYNTLYPTESYRYYHGTFDGGGHTITLRGKMLFYGIDGCTIKNLTVAGYVYFKAHNAAAIAAITYGNTKIINCHNKADVTSYIANIGSYCAGGIISEVNGSTTLESCTNEGSVTASEGRCGGLVGYGAYNANALTLTNCINYGEVSGKSLIGGLIGGYAYTNCKINITACANHGKVTGSGENRGSLVGYAKNATITSCYNDNTENASISLFGNIEGTLTRCYDINGDNNDGVTIFTADEEKSGALCFGLNGETSTDDVVWRQTLGTDTAPNFTGKIVYYIYETCKATVRTYSNEYKAEGLGEHHYDINGFCEYCSHYKVDTNSDGVYEIANAGNLVAFADIVNGSNGATQNMRANAIVTADIDLNVIPNDVSYTSIAPETENDWIRYKGTFDGDGHTVTLRGQSLFYALGGDDDKECIVKNVTVDGTVNGGINYYVGAIAGYSYGNTKIMNCHNKAKVSGGTEVGGILGNAYFTSKGKVTKIDNCTNEGSVTASASGCGGIVATLYSSAMTNCINNGAVKGKSNVGGLAGSMITGDEYPNAKITACANHGTVTFTESKENVNGSLVGYCAEAKITSCYNDNTATKSLPSVVILEQSELVRCYDINGGNTDGVTAFTADEEKSGALCYNLNGGVTDMYWYQTLSGDNADQCPVLTPTDGEANVVNRMANIDESEKTYFNTTEPAGNEDASKFYVLDATTTAISNVNSNEANVNILAKEGDSYTCANAVLQDGTTYAVPYTYTAAKFTYDRTLAKAGIYTFVLPAAISATDINGAVYKLTDYDNGTLYFSDQTDTLAPNTPYIVKVENAENAETKLLKSTLTDVKVSEMTVKSVTVEGKGVSHIGSYSKQVGNVSSDKSYYGYMGGVFVKATSSYTLNPFRTMITINGENAGSKLSTLALDFNTGATGIGSIDSVSTTQRVDVYSTNGMRVRINVDADKALDQLPRGIYIVNGKKMVKTNK